MSNSWQQLYETANSALSRNLFEPALSNFLEATEVARRKGDQDELGQSLRGLAKTYIQLGNYDAAYGAACEAENLDRAFWGFDNQQVSDDMFLAAEALRRQGKKDEAKLLFEQVIAIRTALFGEQHDETQAATQAIAICQEIEAVPTAPDQLNPAVAQATDQAANDLQGKVLNKAKGTLASVASPSPTSATAAFEMLEPSMHLQVQEMFAQTVFLSGLPLSQSALQSVWLWAAIGCGFLEAIVYFKVGFGSLALPAFMLGADFCSTVLLLFLFVKAYLEKTRISKQFPDALEILSSLLCTGYTLNEAMQWLSESGPPPLKPAFKMAVDGQKEGASVGDAIRRMKIYCPTTETLMLADAAVASYSSGGLQKNVETIANSMRAQRRTPQSASNLKVMLAWYSMAAVGFAAARLLGLITHPLAGARAMEQPLIVGLLTVLFAATALLAFFLFCPADKTPVKRLPMPDLGLTPKSKKIRKELPNFLDMLISYLEGGVGPMEAVQLVCKHSSSSCRTICGEIEIYMANLDSFKKILPVMFQTIGKRYDVPELISVGSAFDAAERTGSSIGYQLREESRALRMHLIQVKIKDNSVVMYVMYLAVCLLLIRLGIGL